MKTPFDTSKLSKDRKDWLEIFGSQWGQRKRTTCCDGCVFGERYSHAEWCQAGFEPLREQLEGWNISVT